MSSAVSDSFNNTLDSYEQWWSALSKPTQTVEDIFATRIDDRQRVRAATSLWLAAIALSILLLSPLHYGYGLSPSNIAYHLTIVLSRYVAIIACVGVLYLALNCYRVRASPVDLFVIYTVVAAAFLPLETLLSLPSHYRALYELHQAKSAAPHGLAAGQMAASALMRDVHVSGIIVSLIAPLRDCLAITWLTILGRLLVARFGVDSLTAIRVVALASFIGLPLVGVFEFLVTSLLAYAFMN